LSTVFHATSGGSRLYDEFMAKIDAWARQQHDEPGRSEAIRRLVELGPKAKGK
jgi:hypothetical protein